MMVFFHSTTCGRWVMLLYYSIFLNLFLDCFWMKLYSCYVGCQVYDENKILLHRTGAGLMAQVALDLKIECWDAEVYNLNYTS
jgi:hypothetical protein